MGDFEKLYNLALRFLSYRPRSEKEVRDRLRIKNPHFAEASRGRHESGIKDLNLLIDQVILKLKEYKFIDDTEFAKKWIESRLRFKPRSLRLIKLELKQKGIDAEIIEKLIADRTSQVEKDLESAKSLVERKISRSRNTRLQTPRASAIGGQEFGMTPEKLGRYLASKGFDWDTIKKSIDEVLGKGV